MERFTYETQTPPFGIAIKQVELYQGPTNPAQRTITATLRPLTSGAYIASARAPGASNVPGVVARAR